MDAIAADPTYGEAYIPLGDVYTVSVQGYLDHKKQPPPIGPP